MATIEEIGKAFNIVLGAGLDFPPRADEIEIRIDAWCELLADVPGAVLIQAAKDIAISGERFPSVPRMREQARKVAYNHGRGAGSDPTNIDPLPGVYVLLPGKRVNGEYRATWSNFYPTPARKRVLEWEEGEEPPSHPEFTSWSEAQAWQEAQREGQCIA